MHGGLFTIANEVRPAMACIQFKSWSAECIELDVAEEAEFWEGIQAVKFLGVPELQQQITVTGYPIGGDSLSITQGIVSRVTMSPYTSGAAQLMNIQVRHQGSFALSWGPSPELTASIRSNHTCICSTHMCDHM